MEETTPPSVRSPTIPRNEERHMTPQDVQALVAGALVGVVILFLGYHFHRWVITGHGHILPPLPPREGDLLDHMKEEEEDWIRNQIEMNRVSRGQARMAKKKEASMPARSAINMRRMHPSVKRKARIRVLSRTRTSRPIM
jgi:hypothetical protein